MSRPITFRLDPDSPAGRVFTKWKEAGYEPRIIIENALLCLDEIEPPVVQTMNENALVELKRLIERFEKAMDRLSRGSVDRPIHNEVTQDGTDLDPQFMAGMKKVVRPPVVRVKDKRE